MASEPGRSPRRGFSVVGPAILIALGIVFLLNSLEIVPWEVWATLWRFWPVILILFGIQIILGRAGGNWGLSLLMAVAAVAIIVGLVVAAAQAGWVTGLPIEGITSSEPADQAQPGSVSKDLGNIQEARANVDFGAGRLNLDALPAVSDKLVVVDYSVGTLGRAPRVTLSQSGRLGNLSVTGGENVRFGRRAEPDQWMVHVSPAVPLDLTVRMGAADGSLDLRDLKVRTLNLDVGAANAVIGFPGSAGSTRAFINAGASRLTIEIPPEVGARITSDSGLASITASSRFSRSGGIYTSEDYQTATNRLDIELKAGVSTIDIK